MLYTRIRRICDMKGISVKTMAIELGMSVNALYRWDRIEPSYKKVKAVADYLKITMDELLNGIN